MHAYGRLLILIFALESLLFIPLFFMLFSTAVKWSVSDFALMAVLLLLVALGIETIKRKIKSKSKKLLSLAGLLVFFLLFWAELAVGILNTPFAGN